jgi:hypothetical protein
MSYSVPRVIALMLAIGGLAWAGLLLIFGLGRPGILLVFSLGFMVWATWILRATRFPLALAVRRLVWAFSSIYNLWWFIRMFTSPAHEPFLYTAWWGAASLLSVIALILEKKDNVEVGNA